MNLQQKALKLKLDAVLAARHADFWLKAIDEHGEEKATEFYTHLGLNHIEKKSYEWEGLTLSREPKDYEKIAVKGVANAQESSKESITKILLSAREELITDGLKGIKKLEPATYHELTLQVSSDSRQSLRDRLVKVHRQGRKLVAAELTRGKSNELDMAGLRFAAALERAVKEAVPEDEFNALDELTNLTDSRIANDVQARIIAAATRFKLLGLEGQELQDAIQNEITAGSVSYIDRAATGLANKVINIGRSDEAERRSDDWDRVEYSALLDQNVCEPCASQDGDTAQSEDYLTPAPNPDCAGGDWCRCFHVWINQ